MRALVNIAGTDLPDPSEYTGTTIDLVDQGRSSNGYLLASVVRSGVSKVQLKWNYLTAEQWSNILKLFSSGYGGSFINSVTYYDQVANGWLTKQMYVGDRSCPAFKVDPVSGAIVGYTGASLSLIEV